MTLEILLGLALARPAWASAKLVQPGYAAPAVPGFASPLLPGVGATGVNFAAAGLPGPLSPLGLPAPVTPAQIAPIAPLPSPEGGSEALDGLFDGTSARPPGTAAPEYDSLLEEIQRASFRFFRENADRTTGLIRDRAANFSTEENRTVASMASLGFGLTALGIGASRGWITREEAYESALLALRHLRDRQPHVRGWFYHFVDMRTGERHGRSEVSSIDTALLLAGAVFIGEYFRGTEVEGLARDLYRRVDFHWMMTDGGLKPQSRTLSKGWTPERGFLESRWDRYSEHMLLNLLGLGSPGEPLPAETWDAWERSAGPIGDGSGPLFTHQFSHAWIDFRGKRDRYRDYFANSVEATLANRRATLRAAYRFATYGPNCWGLSACDGPQGYQAYGAHPAGAEHDGTIAPTAAGSSIVFTPELSIAALREMRAMGDRLWGRYGFADGFNADPRWRDRFNAEGLWRSPDAVGIDQGALLVMIENFRSGLVWSIFMRSPEVQRGLDRAGFRDKPAP